MKKILKLVNNERKNKKVMSIKAVGCDATSVDFCEIEDFAGCVIYAFDTCNKDYAGCMEGADDYCNVNYDLHACVGPLQMDVK